MTPRTRCAPSPRSSGERVARALSAFTRVCDALWRGLGEGQRARKSRLSSVAPHPARPLTARHPLPPNTGERVEIEFVARAESISHERARGRCVRCFTLRPADAFYRGGVTERSVMAVGRSPTAALLGVPPSTWPRWLWPAGPFSRSFAARSTAYRSRWRLTWPLHGHCRA